MKGGLVYADQITTVSDTYAEEIKTPFYGEKLDGLINARANCLTGIVNGLDYNEYNPATDPFVEYHYDARTFRKEKDQEIRGHSRENWDWLRMIKIYDRYCVKTDRSKGV